MRSLLSLTFAVLCVILPISSQNAGCFADAAQQKPESAPRNTYGIYDYYEGNKYTSELAMEQVQHVPQWSPTEDNPPLSARKAAEAATKQLGELLPDAAKWTLHSISLEPVFGHTGWVYVITFDSYFHHAGPNSGYLPPMHFYVLLSGAVIEPIVTRALQGRSNTTLHRTPPVRVPLLGQLAVQSGVAGERSR